MIISQVSGEFLGQLPSVSSWLLTGNNSRVSSVQLLSHVQLCNPMNCSMPGLPVHHQLPEYTQTHVLWVSDAIQPSYPLSPPSPPALNLFFVLFSQFTHNILGFFKFYFIFKLYIIVLVLPNLSQHQSLFKWASGGQSTGVSASTAVLPMNTQDWFPLGWTGWISLQSQGLSRVFSNTTVQKHQFFSAQPSL